MEFDVILYRLIALLLLYQMSFESKSIRLSVEAQNRKECDWFARKMDLR